MKMTAFLLGAVSLITAAMIMIFHEIEGWTDVMGLVILIFTGIGLMGGATAEDRPAVRG